MRWKHFRGVFALCVLAAPSILISSAFAQADPRIEKSMTSLKSLAAKLGAPRIKGSEAVAGKDAPALYFGTTKINNNFEVVDAIGKEDGKGMTATFFVRGADEYIRVSTSVPNPDGTGRAIGTVLDPTGKVIISINKTEAFRGEVSILGVPYITGYEPIKYSSGKVMGIYYVGYPK